MEVKMKIHAKNIPSNGGCCGGSDNLFFEIHRGSLADPELFLKVYDSDPIPNSNVNATYPVVKIKGQQLCNSNVNLPFKIKFFNLDEP